MESELSRLASFFSFPFNSPVSPTDLAKAGFYYTGNRDEVICYKCSFKYLGWQKGDVPFLIHSTKSSNCPLVRNDNSDTLTREKVQDILNNHLESVSITSPPGASGRPGDSQITESNEKHHLISEVAPSPHNDITPASPVVVKDPTLTTDQSNIDRDSPNDNFTNNTTAGYRNQQGARDTLNDVSSNSTTVGYGNKQVARDTPNDVYSNSTTVGYGNQQVARDSPNDVSSNNTTVRYGNQQVARDSPNDVSSNSTTAGYRNQQGARTERSRNEQMPHVDITTSTSGTENLYEHESTSSTTSNDIPGNYGDHNLMLEPLGVTESRPKYPQFAVLATRLATYKTWPSHLNQRPEQLAKCGLFYEGSNDYVRCFHCAGGLREWEPQDDPWIEHSRWFPFCTFMRQLKGDRFIMDVQSGKITSEQQGGTATEKKPENHSTYNMDHPAVLSVMDMGYSKKMMAMAISSLKKRKDTSLTAENLLQVVWEIEDSGVNPDEVKEERTEDIPNTVTQTNSDNTKPEPVNHHPTTTTTTTKTTTADMESLVNENRELREQKTCKVCLDEEASIVFLPCGHLVTCPMCSSALHKCPVCRTHIRGTVKAIIS